MVGRGEACFAHVFGAGGDLSPPDACTRRRQGFRSKNRHRCHHQQPGCGFASKTVRLTCRMLAKTLAAPINHRVGGGRCYYYHNYY